MNLKLREITTTAIFTALTAILAQISIPLPFSPVPITFQILAVYISAVILGSKLGALSQLVYVLLGAVGVPVFANFHGGLSVVLGPTGGYLITYPIIAYIIGKISEKELSFVKSIIGLIISLIFCYAIGVLQLSFITKISIEKSIFVGALPFIPLDTIKVIIAYILGSRVREALIKTNLIKC
ncbi:biotin transporter BioY [Clostridium ljungdahlii]|uniref:Biotin transporter n=1 Tax=Clostridium ljungdahlii TaxID=1538 RepID=A0A168M1L5_9CLOT|nr:biotin transporter BioY [Clostridium ljungdahlii]OAA83985.1 Biotin transporter BioY [Clostridium ljungdahlii]